MKRFNRLLAILLVVAMILPGMVGVVEAAPTDREQAVTRIAGSGRVETSVEASKKAFENGGAENVVLAGYNGEVDALAGTLLSNSKKAPLLLTKKNEVPDVVKKELKRLGAKSIYILGGNSVISKGVEDELSKKYTVERLSGSNREATAVEVANEVKVEGNHIFLAKGYDVIADALAIGPVSGMENMPILLTKTGKVSDNTLKAMEALKVEKVTIVGGEAAVSKAVEEQLEDYTVDRVEGTNREETALKIADEYFTNPKKAMLANGYVFADALVGGYLGAMEEAPILLSQVNKMAPNTVKYLKDGIEKAYILGGTVAIDKDVLDVVEKSIKSKETYQLAKEQLETNLEFIYETVENPSFGTGAGEWSILSLARGGFDAPEEYYDLYESNVEKEVKRLMEENPIGKLHRIKGTEHSRLILGLTSIGRDITDVAGYDISEALADFDYATNPTINGPIFALLALDSNNYDIPILEGVEDESTREKLIEYILEREIKGENGELAGWSLGGRKPDVDITGMAIQGLTPYYETDEKVKAAVDRGIAWLSEVQTSEGGYFSAWGSENSESASQVVVALTGLGIDPHNDSRFVKNGNSIIDNLLTFAVKDGGFMHVKPGGNSDGGGAAGEVNGMATDQGTYALVAYDRFVNGQNRLYDMTDVER